jgi:hypothetical protein
MANRLDGDTVVNGTLTVQSGLNLSATTKLPQANLSSQHNRTYGQAGSAASATVVVHEVRGAAGRIRSVTAGSVAAAIGDSTVTVDVRKNGTTVLSSVITLDNGNSPYVSESGTVNAAGVAAGDVLTVVVAATIGTGTLPTGLFANVVIDEDNA